MAYISKTLPSLFLGILLNRHVLAQGGASTEPILAQPESYQRQFVTQFLRDGNVDGYVPGYSRDTNHNNDLRLLAQYTDWALPLVEIRLLEWLSDPKANKGAIENTVHAFEYAATLQSFDVIARVFKGRPELRRWIRQALLTKIGAPEPNGFTKLYYGLDYPDPQVQEIAKELIFSLVAHPLSENHIYVWGAAMVDRYKHEPTTLEILRDPLVEMSRLHNSENPEITRQKIARASKEVFLHRQKTGERKGR